MLSDLVFSPQALGSLGSQFQDHYHETSEGKAAEEKQGREDKPGETHHPHLGLVLLHCGSLLFS